MSDDETQPWTVQESESTLELCHDHRWLCVFGIPLALLALLGASALWFLPDVDYAEAWPMLAVGSLIGVGMALMGLHVSFNREFFTADKATGILTHRAGFGPFTRIRQYPLGEIEEVRCACISDEGAISGAYAVVLAAKTYSLRIAKFVELDPVAFEALRWSLFLNKPLNDPSFHHRSTSPRGHST